LLPLLLPPPPLPPLLFFRNPANFTHDRHYETNGWFYVDNAVANLLKNRYVITMPYMGIPVSYSSEGGVSLSTLGWAGNKCNAMHTLEASSLPVAIILLPC
jgi:hypothetical protein